MNRFDWRDLTLDTPALIEASAGTGKTHTIALLYLRLVCEHDWPPGAILVVTFTELAASELSERIARRLTAALTALDRPGGDAELDAYLARFPRERTRTRLTLALGQLERAPIGTIHGFCRRVLRDFPEATGRSLTLGRAVSAHALIEDCVDDFWRRRVLADPDPWLRHARRAQVRAYVRELIDAGGATIEGPSMSDFELPSALAGAEGPAKLRRLAGDAARYAPRRRRVRELLVALAEALERGSVPSADWHRAAAEHLVLSKLREHQSRPGALDSIAWLRALQRYAFAHAKPHAVVSAALAREALQSIEADIEKRLAHRDAHTYSALIDGVHRALTGPRGEQVAAELRRHFRAAMIDEFQDTDARQWHIFERLLGAGPLLLIGDPKQSIYRFRGGDLLAYLAAKRTIPESRHFRLTHNYRSDPPLLAALNRLYEGASVDPFFGAGIGYLPLQAGLDRAPALAGAALQIRRFDAVDQRMRSRDAAALRACADDIVELLNSAATLREGDTQRAIQAEDLAVLLPTNAAVLALRALLAERDVPVAARSHQSVFAGDTARDLQLLLYALLHVERDSARRAALATPLLGCDARALHALSAEQRDRWLQQFLAWRAAWQDGGIAAVLAAVERDRGDAWLGLQEGRQIATDVRHLLELACAASGDVPAQYDWWCAERAAAKTIDDSDGARERTQRVASDGGVQLMTVHKSKGLQFGVVFVPLAWRPEQPRAASILRVAEHGDRVYDIGSEAFEDRKARHQQEEAQDRARRLYVALTRAQHRLYVYAERVASGELAALIGATRIEAPDILDTDAPTPQRAPRWRRPASAPLPPAAVVAAATWPTPVAQQSFSGLARHVDAAPGAGDEPAMSTASDVDIDPRLQELDGLRGPRFGNALHTLLENGTLAIEAIEDALEDEGQPRQAAPAVAALLRRTLEADLGGGLQLATLPAHRRRAELGFQFRVAGGDARSLYALAGHRGIGNHTLNGSMVGFIDLVVEWQGRFHLIDYKSNALGPSSADYAQDSLDRAMHANQYDLQALIYAVALHRYLGWRLPAYRPEHHLGDTMYLFLRGIGLAPGAGIWRQPIDPARVLAADRLLGGDHD